MPLLDGKYEILAERPLGPGVTRLDATTADGRPVRVDWYELGPDDEAAFERYRRALRRLARDGAAALIDVVSRPGARYVAWHADPIDAAPATPPASPLRERLLELGLAPDRALVRPGPAGPTLVDLPFGLGDASAAAPGAAELASEPVRPATSGRGRLAVWLAGRRWSVGDVAMSWLLTLGLLALAAALWAGGFALRTNDRVVTVPELPTDDVRVAAERLVALGLAVEGVPLASDAPAGTLLAVDPEAGTTLRPGRRVRLTYAVPPGQLAPTTTPALLGVDLSEAERRLAGAGLDVGRVVRVHEQAPPGVVLSQSLVVGSTVGIGEHVDLVVSLGPAPRTTFVPDLVGLDEADAIALALAAGLDDDAIVVERVDLRGERAGAVLSQSIAPYRRVAIDGAVLRLLVTAGGVALDARAGVPDLTGLDEAEARTLAAPLEVRVSYLEDGALPDGVVWQTPAPGTEATGPVTIGVNVRPVRIPVPPVEALVRQPRLREVPYVWLVEPGIPTQTAVVSAVTLAGDRTVVRTVEVRGGDRLEGTWLTDYPGPVRMLLTLNGEPYGGELLVP